MLYALGAYLLLCLALALFQRRLIYFPSPLSEAAPEKNGLNHLPARAISTVTSDLISLGGWHVLPPRASPAMAAAPVLPGASHAGHAAAQPLAPTLPVAPAARGLPAEVSAPLYDGALAEAPVVDLFFHGNAGHRGERTDLAELLAAQGCHAVMFDYRGFGDSGGSPSEEGLARDARAAWEWLRARGVPPERIVVHGESLGTGVAVRLVAELGAAGTHPGGLILEAPFTSLTDAAGAHYYFIPVRWIMRDRYPSLDRIAAVACPLLVFHGRLDEIVPFEQGRRLFEAAPAHSRGGLLKEFQELPWAGHNNLRLMGEEYRRPLRAFLKRVAEAASAPVGRQP